MPSAPNSKPQRVASAVLLHSAFHGYEVAFALVHSLPFDHKHAINTDAFGPVFGWEECSMVEDTE
jgi:hypothetical protein